MTSPTIDSPASPLVFGEVLFDVFLDGSRVLGGAPFNVAWHLRAFGLDPLVVTAVGMDAAGRDATDRMSEWGMTTRGVQRDPVHPTGRVMATIVDGEPAFEIGSEQAYDFIDPVQAAAAVGPGPVPLVYHGTLALRTDRSWNALKSVLATAEAPTFVDLNLREPWWTPDRLRWCLESASWLKLNEGELTIVSGNPVSDRDSCIEAARAMAAVHAIDTLLVTRGAEGSLAIAGGEVFEAGAERVPEDEIVDTVGAGDGFSAVACTGRILEWELESLLAQANRFAADLCRVRGATTEDASLYERHLADWGNT